MRRPKVFSLSDDNDMTHGWIVWDVENAKVVGPGIGHGSVYASREEADRVAASLVSARDEVGVVQGKHHIAGCRDEASIWVEITGLEKGNWDLAPDVARNLATFLHEAADAAEEGGS